MSLPAIEVTGLSKKYVIQHESQHDNLRDTLHHSARKIWRKIRWGTGFESEEFWALRDLSFSVQPGEVLGIVGRNGAGKSTLLKILSRITEPTSGQIKLRGRVASLLEVGTGFHPELTGRENIYLNGAILGMRRAEIKSKFDEIVAFSEVEKFLDTPVKRYSSGMYVRLAFAVAAHLEPEILIVDEVLAVGDAQFQQKCLGKMNDVARSGRTVLLVSHNLGTIQTLCHRALLLDKGQIQEIGPVAPVLGRYYQQISTNKNSNATFTDSDPAVSVEGCQLTVDEHGTYLEVTTSLRSKNIKKIGVEVHLSAANGVAVAYATAGTLKPEKRVECIVGTRTDRWHVDLQSLANGAYVVNVVIVDPMVEVIARLDGVFSFDLRRRPAAGATHCLEQAWNVGLIELDLMPVPD